MNVRGAFAAAIVVAAIVPGIVVTGPSAVAVVGARAGCPSGRIALTFDDGPSDETGRLVRILRHANVPATFFMVGQRVAAAPRVARRVERAGFLVANHSWAHADMRTQSTAEVSASLRGTQRALRRAGTHPTALMRPPYGALDDAARRGIRAAGLTPVLWTIDSRDWTGGTAPQIAARIMSGLRPGATNLVLQHDGIGHSPVSIDAVPLVIRAARKRGYCFTALDENGHPGFPTPRADLDVTPTREGGSVVVTIRIDKPAGRSTSVWLRTRSDTARVARDVARIARRVTIPAGRLATRLRIRVPRDGIDEYRERFRVTVGRPHGVRIGDGEAFARITDRDRPPLIRGVDTVVERSATDAQVTPVRFVLSRPSAKPILVIVTTRPGSADETDYEPMRSRMLLSPGTRRLRLDVGVLPDADGLSPGDEELSVEIVRARRARIGRPATITIRPPEPATQPRVAPRLSGRTMHR
jgi:peptidoglycan/xylan/chitin deacetylase (PgdA/CDA1 family)